MSTKTPCPKCGSKLELKALVDSHDRVWQRWHYCPKYECGFDERTASPIPSQHHSTEAS